MIIMPTPDEYPESLRELAAALDAAEERTAECESAESVARMAIRPAQLADAQAVKDAVRADKKDSEILKVSSANETVAAAKLATAEEDTLLAQRAERQARRALYAAIRDDATAFVRAAAGQQLAALAVYETAVEAALRQLTAASKAYDRSTGLLRVASDALHNDIVTLTVGGLRFRGDPDRHRRSIEASRVSLERLAEYEPPAEEKPSGLSPRGRRALRAGMAKDPFNIANIK